ncbi:MAG: OmpA family protein [Thiotrichaceae bacterium]|nr:OmpA family protein [Thiotrichaceae bacterium]
MMKKEQCCCNGFAKGAWWLITGLGLVSTYFLMFNLNKDPIEVDLKDRTETELSANSGEWANVEIDERGRDILLSGLAPNVDAKTEIIKLVQGVNGVRVVEDNIKVAGEGSDSDTTDSNESEANESEEEIAPEETASEEAKDTEEKSVIEDAKDTEEETVTEEAKDAEEETASEEAKDTEEETASEEAKDTEEETVTEDTKDTEEETAPEDAKDTEEETASEEAKDTEEETVTEDTKDTEEETASEDAKDTEEETASEEAKDTEEETVTEEAKDAEEETASEEAKDTEEETATTDTDISKEAVKATDPLSLLVEMDSANKMILKGVVATEEERDAIFKAAVSKVRKSNVINKITVETNIKPSSWLDNAEDIIGLITDEGSLSIDESGLTLTGAVDNQSIMDSKLEKAKELLDSDSLKVINNLIIDNVQDADAVVTSSTKTDTDDTVVTTSMTEVEKETEEEAKAKAEAEAKEKEEATEAEEKAKEEAEAKEKEEAVAAEEKVKEEAELAAKAKEEELAKTTEVSPKEQCQSDLNSAMAGESIQFRTNSSTIKSESTKLLDTISQVMKNCKSEISDGITISGHTDSRGADEYNLALSNQRAKSVKRYLVKKGTSASQLRAVGRGETQPIADNTTKEGMAKNRRITFIINKK